MPVVSRLRVVLAGSIVAVSLGVGCAELITYSDKAYEKGEKLYVQGKYEDAAGAFRNATQQNARHYESFYALGKCYEQLGREQQALQSYRTALDVAPVDSKDEKAVAFREKAVTGLAQCIANSDSREVELTATQDRAQRTAKALDWYVLAKTYVAIGDADSAIDAYDRATIADPRDFPIAKSFGLYLAQVNQSKRAEGMLIKAYQLNPNDAQVASALRNLGIVPGPSLLAAEQLHSPIVPKGPIPEIEVNVKDKNATPR